MHETLDLARSFNFYILMQMRIAKIQKKIWEPNKVIWVNLPYPGSSISVFCGTVNKKNIIVCYTTARDTKYFIWLQIL